MTDIIIGNSKGLELFVRDADDDGIFDEGERIGDRVRNHDPKRGASSDRPFIVTGFEVHASRVVAWGRELTPSVETDPQRSAELDCLEVLPETETATETGAELIVERESRFEGFLTRVGRGWDRLRSYWE